MDEKTIQRIKKLQALAERGVGGEKTTAQKKLAKLLKDNGINSLDELQKIAFMATGIERRSRAAMIEESEAGNEKTKTTGS